MKTPEAWQARAKALTLHGLLAHWPEATAGRWAAALIGWEDEERARRSLERRLRAPFQVITTSRVASPMRTFVARPLRRLTH
jgi:hypothetical protein